MKIGYYLTIWAGISIVTMFNYDSTDMILKFWLLALFLLILWWFIALENDMKANTDEIIKTIRKED